MNVLHWYFSFSREETSPGATANRAGSIRSSTVSAAPQIRGGHTFNERNKAKPLGTGIFFGHLSQ